MPSLSLGFPAKSSIDFSSPRKEPSHVFCCLESLKPSLSWSRSGSSLQNFSCCLRSLTEDPQPICQLSDTHPLRYSFNHVTQFSFCLVELSFSPKLKECFFLLVQQSFQLYFLDSLIQCPHLSSPDSFLLDEMDRLQILCRLFQLKTSHYHH